MSCVAFFLFDIFRLASNVQRAPNLRATSVAGERRGASERVKIPSRKRFVRLTSTSPLAPLSRPSFQPLNIFQARHPTTPFCFVTPFNHRSPSTSRTTMDFYVYFHRLARSIALASAGRATPCRGRNDNDDDFLPSYIRGDRVGCRSGYSSVSLIDVFLLLRLARSAACKNAIFADDAFRLFFQACRCAIRGAIRGPLLSRARVLESV